MNETEAIMLIAYTGEKWGAAAAVPTEDRLLHVRVLVWMDALGDVDAGVLRAVLARSRTEFPPNVAQIRREVDALAGTIPSLPTWDEFWPWARSVASSSSMFLAERGTARATDVPCPWPALAGVITANVVAGWAQEGLTEHDLEMVIQAHTRRMFDARVARAEQQGTSDVPALAAWRNRTEGLDRIGRPGELT